MTFQDFELAPHVLQAVDEMGFTTPTPVQAEAIPAVLRGKDLMVQAKTGSGKTLAFGLPLLSKLDPQSPDTQVLVIVPTRELAMQVADEIARAAKHLGIMISAIYGGTKMDGQMTDLQWSSIIVGTPGRLRDHIMRGNTRLDQCRTVVLDEADEMLDMGFKDDLEFILGALPKPRLTLLFSATFPKPIEMIARKYMRADEIEKISISSGLSTPTEISHRFVRVQADRSSQELVDRIKAEHPTLGLVFCNRKSETAYIARKLKSAGIPAGFLNGDMDQSQRTATMDQFRKGEITVLVATDVAARGLDISGVSHVFNISVPLDPETYVHRSGRTGRAGQKGVCITLVTREDERAFGRLKKALKAEIEEEKPKTPAETLLEGARDLDAYREFARELLDAADPETLFAALLSQSSLGRRLFEQAKGAQQEEEKSEKTERRKSRRRPRPSKPRPVLAGN